MPNDQTSLIQQRVQQALADKQTLSIHGSNSHHFMLPDFAETQSIDMTLHSGIIDYQPTELTLKARSGTRLEEIEQTLTQNRQRLATDFPAYSTTATLGGAVAIAHTGSGRPILGAIRDHILGASLINGRAELLNCGGQVMKNVAGYDISRMLSGTRGTLGPILDITLKVLPAAELQQTVMLEMDEAQAIENMNRIAGRSLPVTACVYFEHRLYIRLEGTESGVSQAVHNLGGELATDSTEFWNSIQQQKHEFFSEKQPLWRIIVPASTQPLELEKEHRSLIDWCGGLRWIHSDEITQADFIHISNTGGYIENQRGGQTTSPADLLSPLQIKLHQKIKKAFDPDNIFNPKLNITA